MAMMCVLPAFLLPQQTAEPVKEAVERINKGDFAAAIALLEPHTAAHPNDAEALRILARAYYWTGRTAAAHEHYERTFSLRLDDTTLRLEYGWFLVETNRGDDAARILTEVTSPPEAAAEAQSLLGTAAYWTGDWKTAASRFERALQLHPGHTEARRQLAELRAAIAPTTGLSGAFRSDNQPLRRWDGEVYADWHADPMSRVSLRAGTFHGPDRDSGMTVSHSEIALRRTWGRSGLRTEAAAGIVYRRSSTDWTGRVTLVRCLPRSMQAVLSAERAVYFSTSASFSTTVTRTQFSLMIDRSESRGTIAQAGYWYNRYFDDNMGHVVSAWALVPVLRGTRGLVRIGYGFNYQHTGNSRFTPAAAGSTKGAYTPYYTPRRLSAHSLLAFVQTSIGRRMTATVNGAYGFRAADDAPWFREETDGSLSRNFSRRTFTPWKTEVSLRVLWSPRLLVSLEGGRSETAFYAANHVNVSVSYRFIPRAE